MEIGEQALHHGKAVAGLDHQVHRTAVGGELAAVEGRHRLEAAHAGGADGNHTATPGPAGSHRRHQGWGHLHPFAVELQLAEVFRFHRAEGAEAHVQGHPGQLDAPGLYFGQ